MATVVASRMIIEVEMRGQVQEGEFFTIYPFKLVDFFKPCICITLRFFFHLLILEREGGREGERKKHGFVVPLIYSLID